MIKRLRICFLILLFFSVYHSNPVIAQSTFQIGPYWGQGIRSITGNSTFDAGMGWHAGVITGFRIDEKVSLNPSFSYAKKGYYKFDFSWWNGNGSVNQRLSYLDLYIPVKYQVAGAFNIQTGVQAGWLIDGQLIFESYEFEAGYKRNITSNLNAFDFGVLFGLGFQFDAGIGIDFMVNQGIINIYDGNPPDYYFPNGGYYSGNRYNGTNFMATFNVYYLFGYQKKE